jgi:hypothetical protein
MAGPMRKLLPALALVAVAALALTGCDVHLGPYAAVVDGKVITQGTLNGALASAASDSGYLCVYSNDYQAPLTTNGAAPGTWDTAFADGVLSTFVEAQLAADEAAGEHLQVTSILTPVATAQIADSFSQVTGCTTPTKVLSGLSQPYQQALLSLYENVDLIAAEKDGVVLTTTGLSAYIASHPTAGQLSCIDFIQVSSKATADAAESALQSGTSFAAEAAKAMPGQNPDVGCNPVSALTPQLQAPVAALTVGTWTAPISFQGSYVILDLTAHQPATPTDVVELLLQDAQKQSTAVLESLDKSTSVQIDPAYGSWAAVGGTGSAITSPAAPSSKFVPSPSAAVGTPVKAPAGAAAATTGP